MARLDLKRVVRSHRAAIEDLATLVPDPLRVEDAAGRIVFGDAEGGDPYAITSGGEVVGAVFGQTGAERIARLLGHLYEREREKLALAEETLGRYKELTLLYDTSDALSRVLDVDEVAKMVVEHAHRFLRADAAALLLLDRRKKLLRPVASVSAGAAPPTAIATDEGIDGRVLASGRAELEAGEDGDGGARICAPLRSGDAVFGVLRVEHAQAGRWTAGDLKLVTSLAANAASAISHAMLHREQLRQQALRSQIERFVSPQLVAAATEGPGAPRGAQELAVLFCDVGQIAKSIDADAPAEAVLGTLHWATSTAMSVLMAHGATVNVTQGEMLVALFVHRRGFVEGARVAAQAARDLAGAFADSDSRASAESTNLGVGIARAGIDDPTDLATFLLGVGAAATLQSVAEGRILVDRDVAAALSDDHRVLEAERLELSRGPMQTFEVRT